MVPEPTRHGGGRAGTLRCDSPDDEADQWHTHCEDQHRARRGDRSDPTSATEGHHTGGTFPGPSVVARPAAQAPLEGDQRHGAHHQQGGQLGGCAAVAGAEPDAHHAVGDGADVEQAHRSDVGEDLHRHERGTRCERRSGRRHRDPPEGAPRTEPECARRVAGVAALRAERRPGEEVDVGIEREHQRRGAQPDAPNAARPERHGERVEPHEPGDVAGHGQRRDEQPCDHLSPGQVVGRDEPGQAGAEHEGAGDHGDEQHEGVADHAGQPCLPQLRPHLGGRVDDRGEDDDHRRRDEGGDRHDRRPAGHSARRRRHSGAQMPVLTRSRRPTAPRLRPG